MEPVKFEKQAREQLQKREIKPSADSWERLEQRLDGKQDEKGFNLWWIGAVAAVAVVFFFLGTFFGNDEVTQQIPVIVETASEEAQEKLPQENVSTQKEEIRLASEEVKPEPEKVQKMKQTQQLPQQNSQEALAVVSEKPEMKTPSEETSEMAFSEPEKIQEQASEEKKIPLEVNDAEIEALLMLASAEIEADPAYAQSTVNAKELLNEVEYELEESFRDKVFEVIK
ncbi:MAG: hypothetical protein WBL21_10840, partial [Salinimicrobium sp.]